MNYTPCTALRVETCSQNLVLAVMDHIESHAMTAIYA